MRRPGAPADIAGAVMSFASEQTSWVTGQTLLVDGGKRLEAACGAGPLPGQPLRRLARPTMPLPAQKPEIAMDQMVLFVLFGAAMVAGWRGSRGAALILFGLSLVLAVAEYLHHATDRLPLSF